MKTGCRNIDDFQQGQEVSNLPTKQLSSIQSKQHGITKTNGDKIRSF